MKEINIENFGQRLRRHCTALNKLLADAKNIYPDACLYLDGAGSLHLMSGPSHDDGAYGQPRHDRIISTGDLNAGGGDW